ncbi:hypothetical protein ACQP1K_25005 [Sphaerimonospora sp. CA-214678]|uniref:hypothetical protein n=1 Tax=Sphaerimonospora sp. CA-214678 TaxID=3240029 RepID=UPI003D90B099
MSSSSPISPCLDQVADLAMWEAELAADQSIEVRWVPRDQVKALPMDRSMRLRIGHYLTGTGLPYVG